MGVTALLLSTPFIQTAHAPSPLGGNEAEIRAVHVDEPQPVYKHSGSAVRLIEETFPNDPRMVAVLKCESNHRQFDSNGSPLRSPTNDWGIAQINEKVWDAKAKEMGLDYKHSMEDNLKMARYVYDVQGIRAWMCFTNSY